MKRGIIIVAAVATCAAFVGYIVFARSPIDPPKIEELTDTWIGYTNDDLNFYRVTLRKDGTGLCAFVFVREPAQLYEITKWTIKGLDIKFTLKPIDADAEPIYMHGRADGWQLYLTVGGEGWARDLKLRRQSDVESALKRVTERMSKHPMVAPNK